MFGELQVSKSRGLIFFKILFIVFEVGASLLTTCLRSLAGDYGQGWAALVTPLCVLGKVEMIILTPLSL